ncbi:MAG: SprT family zinc-dependent metalloprotease [Mariprofundales bacterium]
MHSPIKLGDIEVDVVFKEIKNIHLSVYPPNGHVRISAPARMKLDHIRVFAIDKIGWIRAQQKKLREQARETPRTFVDGESHYLWGQRYLLKVIEKDAAATVALQAGKLVLQVLPGSDANKRHEIIEQWYRFQLKEAVPSLIAKWEPILGVQVQRFFVQRMKTKWGSCSHNAGSIRLNTELVKKPPECLEYIVAHEMMHLLEPTHNDRFVRLMDRFMPNWRAQRDELNCLPVRHEEWIHSQPRIS